MGERYNTGLGVSLQKGINFGDNIHQETDARTQLADGYGGASQGLPPDYKQAIKTCVVVTSSQSCRSCAVMSLSGVIFDYFPTFIFMELINVPMQNFSFVSFNITS